jgi:hypothetical protein
MPLTLGRYDSPIGPLAVASDDDCLLAIDFNGDVRALGHRLSLPHLQLRRFAPRSPSWTS